MKHILLILVGGTICTKLKEDGTLAVSEEMGAFIKSHFEQSDSPYAHQVKIDLTENLSLLSENMTVDKWNLIFHTYKKYTAKKHYDGVIFAHGTDTLAYSAALFSILLCDTDIPVFFVSSQKPLDRDDANGHDNFRCAVECIAQGISPNVYVPYKNPSDGRMYLHLGSRLEQCKNYSDDFYSHGMLDITSLSKGNFKEYFELLDQLYPPHQRKAFFRDLETLSLSECVLLLQPYVGMNYNAYRYSDFSAILHGTYHSGTACAEKDSPNSLLHLIELCGKSEKPIDIYLSPSKLTGEIYETVRTIGNSNIRFLYGYTQETAYAKLLIAYSLFDTDEKRTEFLATPCNFEQIEKEGDL